MNTCMHRVLKGAGEDRKQNKKPQLPGGLPGIHEGLGLNKKQAMGLVRWLSGQSCLSQFLKPRESVGENRLHRAAL